MEGWKWCHSFKSQLPHYVRLRHVLGDLVLCWGSEIQRNGFLAAKSCAQEWAFTGLRISAQLDLGTHFPYRVARILFPGGSHWLAIDWSLSGLYQLHSEIQRFLFPGFVFPCYPEPLGAPALHCLMCSGRWDPMQEVSELLWVKQGRWSPMARPLWLRERFSN